MAEDYPTITSDPSQPSESPEEDIGGGDYTSALGFSALNESAEFRGVTAPVAGIGEIETQRQNDFRAQPVPSDEEAAQLYERLPFVADEDRSGALQKLNRYALDLEEKENAKRNEERKREFLDPKARLDWLDQDEVKNNLGYLDDSNAAYDRQMVRKQLEQTLGRKLSEPEYEAARNELIGRKLAGKPKISDQEAFGVLGKQVEKAKEEEEVLKGIAPKIILGVIEADIAKKPFVLGDVWDKTRKGMSDLTPERENELYEFTAQKAEEIKARVGRNGDAITATYSYFQKLNSRTATEADAKAAFDALRSVPHKDLEQSLIIAAEAIKTGEVDPGIIKNALTKYWRLIISGAGAVPALKGMSNTAADAQIISMRAQLESGASRITEKGDIIWTPVSTQKELGKPLTPEQKAQAHEKLNELWDVNRIDRAITNVLETKVRNVDIFSPTTAHGIPAFIERSYFGAQAQIGPMALMMLSPAAYMAVIGSQSYEATMLANPDMDPGVAAKMASSEAVINFIGDSLQLGRAKSFIQGLFKGIPAGRKLARAAWTFGIETATEVGQDYFSEVAKRAVQETMMQIDPELDVGTRKKWEDMMSWAQVGETAGQMFFLAGIGVGVLTYRDLKDPARAVYNDDTLRRAGIPQDKIDAILSEEDFGVRDQMARAAMNSRTPEQKNNGIIYSQEQDAKVRENVATAGVKPDEPDAFVPPRLVAVEMKDGTRRFNLLDANGTVVREGMTEEVANAEHEDLVRTSFGEYLQKQVEARQTEEAEAKGVAAETKWNILSAQEKTTLGNILEYEYVKQPTPEQQKGVEGLKQLLAQRQQPVPDLVAVSVEQPTTRAGKLALNFVRWFEDTFKKQVVFVASASGESLPFDGAVNSSDPNTIFLNAAGNRNVLSLLGHEWSHTLEKTNPKLWKDVMERMQPMIMDWAVQVGKVDASYDPEERTKEFVANVIGDAFGDPEFWKMVREKDANLFRRMLQAVQEWFDNLIAHESEWGTQDVVKDLKGLRELISEAMKTAEAGPEVEAGAAAGVQTAAQRHKVQLASRRIEKGFYSKLEDFVSGPKAQKVSSPEQVKATINGAGIKAEEIKWSGVMPKIDEIAAENAGKVPKEKLVTHLEDEGSVKFEEVTLASKSPYPYTTPNEWQQAIDRAEANQNWDEAERIQRAWEGVDEDTGSTAGMPRYTQYVLPGGENYREVVLAMPDKLPKGWELQPSSSGEDTWYVYHNGKELDIAIQGKSQAEKWIREKAGEPSVKYISSHFPNVPNYVAHMRLSEREGGLFIEEIQSDRHQQGREKGYMPEGKATLEEAKQIFQISDANWAAMDQAMRQSYADEVDQGGGHLKGLIPDAPFRKDWPLAMFKRALRDAVATGKSWIGWTSGETQADRYDLSKQVDQIIYLPSTQRLAALPVGEEETKHLGIVPPEKLSDFIGKEAASRLLQQPVENGFQVLKGVDLKLGGEGMKGFYDKMLPNEIGKYVKQWGGKVEQGNVQTQEPSPSQPDIDEMGRSLLHTPIWKVEITPQMKVGVNEGQVQFALPREEAPRRKPHVPGETVPVTVFDKDAGTFVPTPMKPTRELLKILRVEQRTYNDLLKCLAA